jgi:predicted Zn-dependent protease
MRSADDRVDLSATLEMWNDVLRDADAVGIRFFRSSDKAEMEWGNQLVEAALSYPSGDATYVSAVMAPLVAHVRRRGITYTAHVVDTPIVNAWATPGGHIWVTSGLLRLLKTEAELAAVLGHEIEHVDSRHCIDRYEYQMKLARVRLPHAGALVDFVRYMATASYTKYQEAEADAAGLRLTIEAGYDPSAIRDVIDRLSRMGSSRPSGRPGNVAAEVEGMVLEAAVQYLDSHPQPDDRLRRLNARLHAERRRITGRRFYVGADNYARGIPRARYQVENEWRTGV